MYQGDALAILKQCFYPRCGFFSVATVQTRWHEDDLSGVSIRDADFLALQRRLTMAIITRPASFYPRCGFFSVATGMRRSQASQALAVSIRDADFLALQLQLLMT